MRDGYLALTAFVAGLCIMGLEILGFRMFAPYFGYSVYVSGTLIGVVMIALSVGYFVGGMWADKKPDFSVVFHLIIGSVIYLVVIALLYIPLLSYLSGISIIWGTFIGGFVIFGPPMLLLSMVSPYIVKLIAHAKTVGMASGKVSGIATAGSIIGTFLTTFFLIPFFGTYATLIIMIVMLLVIAVIGLVSKNKLYLTTLLILLAFSVTPHVTDAQEVKFNEESLYNTVKVEYSEEGSYSLRLNSNRWLQTRYNLKDNLSYTYVDFMTVGSLIAKPKKALVLGMGAGSSVQHLLKFSEADVTALEIDQLVVDVSHIYFNVPEKDPRLRIVVDDARPFLKKDTEMYDLIELDMYHGGIFVPFYVVTEEFFTLTHDRLNEDGILVMNVYAPEDHPDKMILVDSIAKTMSQVYPSIYFIETNFNVLLIASKKATDLNYIRKEILSATIHPALVKRIAGIDRAINTYTPSSNAIVLTDDKAPIEQLTYELVK